MRIDINVFNDIEADMITTWFWHAPFQQSNRITALVHKHSLKSHAVMKQLIVAVRSQFRTSRNMSLMNPSSSGTGDGNCMDSTLFICASNW